MSESESKISEAQQKAVNKYIRNNYDRIIITVPKKVEEKRSVHFTKQDIKDAATLHNESVNTYICTAIQNRLDEDHE